MTTHDRQRTRERLDEVSAALLCEFDHLPPGSVLRCFTRAVLVMRRTRVAEDDLPARVDTFTRTVLAARQDAGLHVVRTLVAESARSRDLPISRRVDDAV